MHSLEQALHLAERVPFEPDAWFDLIDAMAKAGGAWAGQIIGPSIEGELAFDWLTGLSPDAKAEFERRGGGVPHVNPRAFAGVTMPVFATRIDSDFITADAMEQSALYQEVFHPLEADFICMSRLETVGKTHPIAAMIRSRRQGAFDEAERSVLQYLAPHISKSLRLHSILERDVQAAVSRGFEALNIAAFVLDRFGSIRTLTSPAEKLLQASGLLICRNGRLAASNPASDRELQAALRRALLPPDGTPSSSSIIIRNVSGDLYCAEIARIPQSIWAVCGTASTILIIRSPPGMNGAALIARHFGLTAAEVEVAIALATNADIDEICKRRNVSRNTTRTQLKSIFAKIGVSRQIELVRVLTPLLSR